MKKVAELLATGEFVADAERSKRVDGRVFVDARGRGLWLPFPEGHDRFGCLYDSVDDWVASYEAAVAEARKGPVRLATLLPQERAFIEHVPALVSELSVQLGIPAEALDGSESSLGLVERRLRREPERHFDPARVAPLVAYVGEVLRKATDGRWEMRFREDTQDWEPYIVARGRSYGPLAIFKELVERPRSLSLKGVVGAELGKYGFAGGIQRS